MTKDRETRRLARLRTKVMLWLILLARYEILGSRWILPNKPIDNAGSGRCVCGRTLVGEVWRPGDNDFLIRIVHARSALCAPVFAECATAFDYKTRHHTQTE